jgi:(p)ppGpp synthase/HD superfamily hydrolase
MKLFERARKYAIFCHNSTNHLYDNQSYEVHLRMVVKWFVIFRHLVPEQDSDKVESAAWCHDVLEDTRQTYNDVSKRLGKDVADMVYALTNEKGKTRKERANKNYYIGIRKTKYAILLKLADRLANVEYSRDKGSSMYETYKKEYPYFKRMLYTKEYIIMFKALENMLKIKTKHGFWVDVWYKIVRFLW